MKILLAISIACLSFSVYAKFSHESELSFIQSGGNTEMETTNLKTINKEQFGANAATLSGHYTQGQSKTQLDDGSTEKKENARNWDVQLRFDRDLSDSVDLFTAVQYEGDEFSGYKQRENYDLGAKYKLINTDDLKSNFELGYRYTTERRTTRNDQNRDVLYFNKGRVYYDIEQNLNKQVSYKFWTEYIPNFTETKDYQVIFEPSLNVVMTEIFSLKVSYKGTYDNVPNKEGNEYLDWIYSTSILAKF